MIPDSVKYEWKVVKKLLPEQRKEALDLAWKVFQQFEAPEYSKEGIEEFHKFITYTAPSADMEFWGAFINEKLVGMLASRAPQHLSLFFVDARYQHVGIGKKLFEAFKREHPEGTTTVNSSPYAVDIYARLGFVATNSEQVKNGIRFTPMIYTDRRTVRPAVVTDIPAIMTVMDAARRIMRSSGNMNQWTGGYPSEEIVKDDIASGYGHVVADEGAIVGYFAWIPSPEPTYNIIYSGRWTEPDGPYHVIHRIASIPDAHGVFGRIIAWCGGRERNIRIDTHRDNRIMQHCIKKAGFKYCGIIYLASGDERLAYQRIK